MSKQSQEQQDAAYFAAVWPDRKARFIVLNVGLTDEQLIGIMRQLEDVSMVPFLFSVSGVDEDPRYVYEIPDCVELFKRLVRTGMISQMVVNHPLGPGASQDALGSFNVWASVQGLVFVQDGQAKYRATRAEFDRFIVDLKAANRRCFEVCGKAGAQHN